MGFCKEFNARTQDQAGLIIPVVISVYEDRSFTFITKTPPAPVLLKKAAKIEKASSVPNRDKVATVSKAQVQEIAELKMADLNAASVEAAMRMIEGTARSMGILVGEQEDNYNGKKKVKNILKQLNQQILLVYTLQQKQSNQLKKTSTVNFDATVEVAFRLGVDTRKNDQQVRGAVVLPKGTGKTAKVLVFAKGDKAAEAEAAGADYVGQGEYITKIQQGWFDFDVIVATPDMMGEVGKIGRVLGPKGLMPNPKTGTVTMDVTKAVNEIKAGKVEYRAEKAGVVHTPIGKVSFSTEDLVENFNAVQDALAKAKPAAAKGTYFKSVAVTTTMGPGVRVNTAEFK